MANNLIATLANNTFTYLTELVELNVANNLVETIEANTFASNKQLKNISLANNRISHLDCAIFSSLINLESLDLSKNELRIPSEQSFVININDNKLEQLTVTSNMVTLEARLET